MTSKDLIYRQQAIEALGEAPKFKIGLLKKYAEGRNDQWFDDVAALVKLPSAQPERLTDDDFETIRIHLNACKEKLCNQRRWKEAEEYRRIIDRFMAFASVYPERKMGKWILCEDELPEAEYGESKSVLCTCTYRNAKMWKDCRWLKTLYYNGGCWCLPTGETYIQKVIAWMPLPEPYGGENGENT